MIGVGCFLTFICCLVEDEGRSIRWVEVEGGCNQLLVKYDGGKSIDLFVAIVMMSVSIC